MTPGNLLNLVVDNVQAFDKRLTQTQDTFQQEADRDVLLRQDIIVRLRDIPGGQLALPELEPRLRLVLKERQEEVSRHRQQMDEWWRNEDQLVSELRPLVRQRESRMPQLWQEHVRQPAFARFKREYQELLEAHDRLQESLSLLIDERDRKMPAYESNPFYVYLRGRRYGTEQYSRGGLFRQLDDWLANKVSYTENRRNEITLRSMPDRVTGMLNEYIDKLQTLHDQNAANWTALTGELRTDATAQRRTLLAKQIIAAQAHGVAAYDQFAPFVDGEDDWTQEIEDWLDAQLDDDDLDLEGFIELLTAEQPAHSKTLQQCWEALNSQNRKLENLDERLSKAIDDYQRALHLHWALATLRREENVCGEHCNCHCHHAEEINGMCPCAYEDARFYTYPSSMDAPALITSYMKGNLELDDLMELFSSQRHSFDDSVPNQLETNAETTLQ